MYVTVKNLTTMHTHVPHIIHSQTLTWKFTLTPDHILLHAEDTLIKDWPRTADMGMFSLLLMITI